MKSLAAGVPMVVLPHGRDQADNAVRVTSRGAGIAIKRNAGKERIAAAIERVLKQASYRENASRLGTAIRRDAAGNTLIGELEAVGQRTSQRYGP